METKIVLRQIEPEDLPKIARVHSGSFPDSALTKLGAAAVERYYLWQLTGPHEKVRATGAFSGGECAGFCFGGLFTGSTSGFIKKNKFFLAKEVLRRPRLILNPLFFSRVREGVRLLFRVRRKKNSGKNTAKDPAPKSFGILSIAVSVDFQKMGIGQMLMRDAEREAVRTGFAQMDLSVHPTNRQAVRFYEKLDWQKKPAGDAWKGVMIKKLESGKASAAVHSHKLF